MPFLDKELPPPEKEGCTLKFTKAGWRYYKIKTPEQIELTKKHMQEMRDLKK